MQTTIDKIRNYINLDNNWDGYGGKPLTANVVEDAIKIYKTIFQNFEDGLRLHVGPSADNEIVFTVRSGSDILICSVFGDGKHHFYAKLDGLKRHFNNVPIQDPKPLLAVLENMAKNSNPDIAQAAK